MVRFEVEGGVDPLLLVRLEKGDAVATESNAMVAMDRSLTLKGKTRGGFFGSIARKFLNEETLLPFGGTFLRLLPCCTVIIAQFFHLSIVF